MAYGAMRQSQPGCGTRSPLPSAPANGDHCQHGSDKQQLPNLHADIEEQQGDRDGRLSGKVARMFQTAPSVVVRPPISHW